MDKEAILKKTEEHIKGILSGEGSGHDWWHVYRVWRNSVYIGKNEDVDLFVVQLAALLHDISDWKFNDGDDAVLHNYFVLTNTYTFLPMSLFVDIIIAPFPIGFTVSS
jgi:HD superfamily phosphodiesterase